MSNRNKRIAVTRYGPTEVLKVVEEDIPEPNPGEVRVRILTAGASFADVLLREGIHPEARRPPFTPGWDIVDNNLLACSDGHIRKVFAMLASQKHRARFSGGFLQPFCDEYVDFVVQAGRFCR